MARFNQSFIPGKEKIWNMDQLFTERIDRLIEKLDDETIASLQVNRYRILHTIFMNTHFKFNTTQNDELKKEFKEIKRLLNTPGNSRQHTSVVFSMAENKIDEITLKLINLLYEADLIGLKRKEKKRTGITFAWDD